MKKAKFVTFFLSTCLAWKALYPDVKILEEKIDVEPSEDELISIDRMVKLTEKQQEAQLRLKDLIVDLRHNKEQFMKGEECKLYAHYMIRAAKESLFIIKTYHLEHLFSSEFLEELAIYTKIGTKEVRL